MNDIEKNINNKYSNCISLGWFCGTASAMSKYGFRSFSGPFDWYFSDLKSVITHIENDFSDFIDRDNLVPMQDNPRRIYDKKYGYSFFHDIKTDLKSDYEDMCTKYNRRILRFTEMSKMPTIFLRAVRSPEEVKYISEEYRHIDSIIKKYNSENIIVYLLTDTIGSLPDCVLSFELNIDRYAFDAMSLRCMFDRASELVQFCRNHLKSEYISNNIRFDSDSNSSSAAEVFAMIKEEREEVADSIRNIFNICRNEGIYLWGIGYHGKAMLEFLTKKNIVINGLADSNLCGREYMGYVIGDLESIPDDSNVMITIADRKSVDSIKNLLETKRVVVCDYQRLYENLSMNIR